MKLRGMKKPKEVAREWIDIFVRWAIQRGLASKPKVTAIADYSNHCAFSAMQHQPDLARRAAFAGAIGALAFLAPNEAGANTAFPQYGFAATGASANRTMPNRLIEIKNIKDFGAVGDASADDTVSIRNAINYLGWSVLPQGAASVFCPPGVYKTTEPIDFATAFSGAGNNNSICLFGVGGASRIQGNFAGYIFTNSFAGPVAGGGIIANLSFANPHANGGCVKTGAVIGWTIQNCSFSGSCCLDVYNIGNAELGPQPSQSVSVLGCIFSGGGLSFSVGIICGEGTAVQGCDITGLSYGIVGKGTLNVTACRFEVISVAAITLGGIRTFGPLPPTSIVQSNGWGQCFIGGNTFESCDTVIDSLGSGGASLFAGLGIHGGMSYGIRTRGQMHDCTFTSVHVGGGQTVCGIQVSPFGNENTNLIFINCSSASNGVNSWDIAGASPGSFAINAADAVFIRCTGDDATPFIPVWTFAKLPTTGISKSEQYFITDANTSTLGANVTAGGGSTNGYVVWNGTNWTLASK